MNPHIIALVDAAAAFLLAATFLTYRKAGLIKAQSEAAVTENAETVVTNLAARVLKKIK